MAKKDFSGRNNPAIAPALQFITTTTEATEREAEVVAVPASAATPTRSPAPQRQKKEVKSKRLNLLLRPSVYESLKKIAWVRQKSLNDLINEALTQYTREETQIIARYNEVFRDE